VDTTVLEVASEGHRYIVKAAGPANTHIGREIEAHKSSTAGWIREGRAARLVQAAPSSNLLVTEYLEGSLVEGTDAEFEPDTYLQAGRLLQAFHSQSGRSDDHYESVATAKALSWLEKPHRMDERTVANARAILDAYEPEPVRVVPTHGDWQPRNWLAQDGQLRVIDFGRFEYRPAITDFCRLTVQQWREGPPLEEAFFEGYGPDPRHSGLWNMLLLREAISTAAWAYQVGNREFEDQGHRMLREALANFQGFGMT
jgi:hypothetical protein